MTRFEFHGLYWVLLMQLAGTTRIHAGEAPSATAPESAAKPWRLYVGTYTGTASKGIYLYHFDPQRGSLHAEGLAAESENPTFLALGAGGKTLYVANEIARFREQESGAVSAFAVEPDTGRLRLLNQQPSGGVGPCHVSVDPAGRAVLVANYSSGSVAMLPIRADGQLAKPVSIDQHQGSSTQASRQAGPHAHSIQAHPAGRFALSADLGTDKLYIYRLDGASQRLVPADPPAIALPPGSGPRHFAIHPNSRFVYVVNELNSTLSVLESDFARGSLSVLQTLSTLPEGAKKTNYPADVHIHPSGQFLYSSNRGHDTMAVFAVDQATGRLRPVEHVSTRGKWPRNFALDPSGRWLLVANQHTNSLCVYRIDPQTGRLTAVGDPVDAPTPACVVFAPL